MAVGLAVALAALDTTLHKPRATPRESLADTTSIARAVCGPSLCQTPLTK